MGLFLLTFFTFCYFLLFFLLLVTSINYFFIVEGSLFVTFLLLFLLFVIFINYFLLLRRARGIVLLYLIIVKGEGVCLDLFFLNFFTIEGEAGGTSLCFFFLLYI